MKKRNVVRIIAVVLLAATAGFGQGSTFHVFPQVVDGVLSDGSSYVSLLSIENLGANGAACSLFSSGVPLARFAVTATRNIPAGVSTLNLTQGTGPFASGYMTVSCTQPVQANLMYLEAAPSGALESMATVSSAPPIYYASFLAITGGPWNYGVAIANPSAAPISVSFAVNFADGTFTTNMVQIPAYSRFVQFLSNVLPIPSTIGLVNIEIFSSSSYFNLTALLYSGSAFTTLVPATVP